jgi:uncharacterized protein (DUF885 family)
MLNRREVLLSAGALSLAPVAAGAAPAVEPASDPATAGRLNALFEQFMQQNLARSPQLATRLGLDKGALASAKSRLDDRSLEQRERDKADTEARRRALGGIDRGRLRGGDALGYETIAYVQDTEAEANRRFAYGGPGAGSPYVVSQLEGAYLEVPDFLDTQHSIKTQGDAQAYLARLEALAVAMDQENGKIRHDAAAGCVPPAFIIDTTLKQMKAFADTPAAQATLVESVARRARAAGLDGDYARPATALYDGKVLPALRRQMALLESLRARANPSPGAAGLPDGEAYYAAALKAGTTTDLSPAQAHRLGLEQVARLSAELDAAFKAQGLTQGAVWQRLRALFADPRFLYPNTEAGKAKLIADLNVKVKAVQARLPAWFGTLPKAGVEIRRVPPAIEAGASSNYQAGTLDGSRPGAYYIVLRDTAEDPSWLMPTLTYHEAIPGHHLQGTLAQETDLPTLRRIAWFSAYGEGWALYAEQLADEMGMYEGDPFGRIGYLHDALLRAARIVMDTGLHAMGWSREQAIRYFVENQGDPQSAAVSEVERYCVWPGQACSYMIGKLEWLRLRAKAKAALGQGFDIRRFHDAGLLSGALPLTVLDRAIDRYISTGA